MRACRPPSPPLLQHIDSYCVRLCAFAGLLVWQASPVFALELNQATEAELDGLHGLGPALTRRVLQARQVRAFASWDDFRQRVSGMGAAKARALSAQGLTIEGQAFLP